MAPLPKIPENDQPLYKDEYRRINKVPIAQFEISEKGDSVSQKAEFAENTIEMEQPSLITKIAVCFIAGIAIVLCLTKLFVK